VLFLFDFFLFLNKTKINKIGVSSDGNNPAFVNSLAFDSNSNLLYGKIIFNSCLSSFSIHVCLLFQFMFGFLFQFVHVFFLFEKVGGVFSSAGSLRVNNIAYYNLSTNEWNR